MKKFKLLLLMCLALIIAGCGGSKTKKGGTINVNSFDELQHALKAGKSKIIVASNFNIEIDHDFVTTDVFYIPEGKIITVNNNATVRFCEGTVRGAGVFYAESGATIICALKPVIVNATSFNKLGLVADTYDTVGNSGATYLIYSAQGLKEFSDLVNYYDLQGDINGELQNDLTFYRNGNETNFIRIGYSDINRKFMGDFNGNGHTISGIVINENEAGANNYGLFGCIGNNGIVSQLTLNNSYITAGQYSGVGAIAGNNEGVISNCTTSNSVLETASYIGGIVGYNNGEIRNCKNGADVIATGAYAGGIVGSNEGEVSNCINEGIIVASEKLGGIAGISTVDISISSYGNINQGIVSNSINTATSTVFRGTPDAYLGWIIGEYVDLEN